MHAAIHKHLSVQRLSGRILQGYGLPGCWYEVSQRRKESLRVLAQN
nr:MAG TPA: protein of unknown function (DUF4920) [Caudoviricetes sp.]